MEGSMSRYRTAIMILAVLGIVAACATAGPPPGTPTVERWTQPPVGSSWVSARKDSGSYGSGTSKSTIRFLGEQDFQGKKYLAYSLDETDVSYYDPSGRLVGRTVKGVLRETNDPGFQAFAWPLHVGKSWVHNFRFTDHAANRSFDNVQFWSKVEAYEDVKAPVGTFKAFRIVHDNQSVQFTNWWSPDLRLIVKSKAERKSSYYAGPGTREAEVVSYEIKK
jgi:hypothetical protein